MSLKIYHGSRIEDLAEKALAELASDGRGPFEKSCVIVSNPLRAQWLKRCALLDGMAGGRKIFANVEFRTIEQFVSEAARAIRPTDSLSPDMSTLAMRIYALLADVAFLHEEAMSIPRAYLLKSGSIDIARTYALAREIAKLFAKYQVYRPEMLRSWEDSPETKSPDAIWQSAIWRQLHLQMKERGEQTVNDVLFELGRLTDEDRATALKRGRQGYRSVIVFDVPQIPSAYQDFLTALGEQGAVSSYEVECRLDCGVPAISPEEGVELQIHGCYMPRRELEAIRNGLYDWFEKGQKRTESGAPEGASVHRPRTALVLCADFANYAPVLESVFGVDAEKGELKIAGIGSSIPVKVVGRVARGGGALCETFMTLFDMPESRFTCSELMNILEQPSVFARFGFDDEDRRFVRSMVQNGNIRWGYDDAHVRKILELEPESTRTFPFTWRRGIDRMLLGALEGTVGGDDFGVVHVGAARFIKPNSRIHGEQARRAAKLDRFLEVLNGIRNELPKSRTADGWSDYLHGIVDCCFLRVDEQSGRMIAAMHRAIESAVECLREISKGDVDAQHPFALLRDTVTAKLEDISLDAARRRTVANAVVFAPLAVGAAFPADLVWICGLNNAAFPRKSTPRAFDLMGQVPAVGDPSPRNDDRIAFCEAVRCARSRLALSFQSRDARTNKEFPPSVFVAELEDKVGAGNIRFLWHSLHGFNPRYFKPGSGLSSWSEEDYMAACAAQGRTQAIEEEGTVQAFSLPDGGTTVDAPVEIDLDDFCSYCYNPDRFIRERVLDATREGDVGAAFDDSEEFFRKQLDLGALKGRWSTLESVADLATRYGEMDDAHIERFVASLQEEGLVADDYDVNMTKDALKGVWRSGAELRTLPIKELGGRTALQALAEQGYNPDYVDVKTPVLKLEGQLDGKGKTIYCRLVGQIPVVPKTKVHLQKALTGKPPVWDRARMAVYRTLADEYKINVKLYEVLPQAMPLVESTKVLSDLYEDAPDFEELLYEAFGMLRTPADEQEA